MSASVAIIIGLIICFMLMSVPQYIEVAKHGITLFCLMEVTIIEGDDIQSIEWHDVLQWRNSIPIAAMLGFGGYCGYWLSLSRLSFYKIYATNRKRCIRIRRRYNCDIIVGGIKEEALYSNKTLR